MKRFNLYCVENEEFIFENKKWKKIKAFGFELMLDRANSPFVEKDDVLSLELKSVTKDGFENTPNGYVKDFLKEWGFELTKLRKKGK